MKGLDPQRHCNQILAPEDVVVFINVTSCGGTGYCLTIVLTGCLGEWQVGLSSNLQTPVVHIGGVTRLYPVCEVLQWSVCLLTDGKRSLEHAVLGFPHFFEADQPGSSVQCQAGTSAAAEAGLGKLRSSKTLKCHRKTLRWGRRRCLIWT